MKDTAGVPGPNSASCKPQAGATRYALHPACRVRREEFGLLFYDLRGPRLLFAETGGLLEPEFFRRGGAPGAALCGRPLAEQARVERFLTSLVRKGFVLEQPVC